MPKSKRFASSIKRHCEEHDISRSFYYELQKKNLGPKTMKVGGRRLISDEASAEWRRRMEDAEG